MTDPSASISILIITYNRADDLLAFLKNLTFQEDYEKHVGELLILNNASTDSYEEVEDFIQKHPALKIKYIPHHENLGVARGRNYLFKIAKFPYFLVLDDDMEFPETDAIKKLSQFWKKDRFKDSNTGLITFGVFYYDTRERQRNTLPHKQYDKYVNKDWFLTYYFAGGANIMKKEIIEKVGELPEDFFYGMEEYDLSYRMIQAGYTLAYDGEVNILHKESPLGRIPNSEKLQMMWYNKSKVTYTYLPKKYFYSTAFLWSIFFLRNSKFDIKGYFKNWKKILTIPKSTERKTLDTKAMTYLKEVEARLWY